VTKSIESRLSSLVYFQRTKPPALDADYLELDLATSAGASRAFERYNIVVKSNGRENLLYIHRDARRLESAAPLDFNGSNNVVILDKENGFHGWMKFEGSDNLVTLLGGAGHLALGATLYSGDTLISGRGVNSWGIRVWVQGGTICTIDDDCLFSENIQIRTTDHHSIIDLETWTQANRPADIIIGRHVWIGANCSVTKGSNIGEGSIIAPMALVSGRVPPKELWGGVPARMIRHNVSWVPSHPLADPAEIAVLRDLLKP
jgi:acetyltransferase-like isoleucine patch superfamily enzyme